MFSFFSSKQNINLDNCRIISDPEGYDINQLLNIGKSVQPLETGDILILGDLLDSTFAAGKPSLDQLKTKSYNIRNLDLVNKNDNIHVAMGNRDLNKIKLKQLLALEDNLLADKPQYSFNDIVIKLKEMCSNPTNPWIVKKLTDENGFSPFWNLNRNKNKDENIGRWKQTTAYTRPTKTCIERFNIIFGQDGPVGTMSAQNLLETIPMELEELGFINENFATDNETKAACVIAFFKLALMDSTTKFQIMSSNSNSNINIVGILRRFYEREQNFVCAYTEFGNEENEENKQIALFSHGGITKSFIETKGFYEFKLKSSCTDEQCITVEEPSISGGFLGDAKQVSLDQIKNRIDEYNGNYKTTIRQCLEEPISKDNITPSENALYLLATSAPTKVDKYDAEKHSPIMPGIYNMRKEAIICSSATIYNFFGHKPDGFGPVVDKFTNNNNISYNINCDFSNTLIGNLGRVKGDLRENYAYLKSIINNNILKLYNNSKIIVSDSLKNNLTANNLRKDGSLFSDSKYNLLELPDDILSYAADNDKQYSALGKYISRNGNNYLLTLAKGFTVKPIVLTNDKKQLNPNSTFAGGSKTKTTRNKKRTTTNKRRKGTKGRKGRKGTKGRKIKNIRITRKK
jgi:hypothetical protein